MSEAPVKKGLGDTTARTGTQALSLLAIPINAAIVHALEDGPMSVSDLRRATWLAPQTTLRGYLKKLTAAGLVARLDGSAFPRTTGYELTASGRGLLQVSANLSAWLERSPGEPVALGSNQAKRAIGAVIDGWSSSMIRALAARPLSLTEMDSLISTLSYPSLERRLQAMRQLGLLEAVRAQGRSTPYGATDWLRRAIAPIAAASYWEHRHMDGAAPPVTNRDIEAAFLLAVPLVGLPEDTTGSCRLAVQMRTGGINRLAGVVAEARGGTVSCAARLEGSPDASALGSAGSWYSAVVRGNRRGLELIGEQRLATSFVEGMHHALFGPSSQIHPLR